MQKKQSAHRAETRKESFRRGQERHRLNALAQSERERENKALRRNGDLTLWDIAKELRLARREAAREALRGAS